MRLSLLDDGADVAGFSALQRAEIAEIDAGSSSFACASEVSVLFNEPKLLKFSSHPPEPRQSRGFSALQRAEIAEMRVGGTAMARVVPVSVLFNEPKLLK